MEEIKRITGLIEQKRKTIERLNADLANARDTVSGAGQYDAQLESLCAERRDIMARAYVSGKPADVKSLNAKIENTAAQAKAARELAEAARDASEIIERGINLEESELDSLEGQLKSAIRGEIIARHDEAAERYAIAITELGSVVAQMAAAERAWEHAAVAHGHGSEFPRRGLRVLEDIRTTGVRVPVSASRLTDPAVAAEYGDSFEKFWYLPAWAHPSAFGFGDKYVTEIVEELRKAGVEIYPFAEYVPAAPEPQLKVRIRRGTIQGAPKIQRNPETDKVVARESVEWKEGDDVMLDESQARRLQQARLVYIHGEDEIPEPVDPTDDNRVELVDERKPRRISPHQSLQESYRGNFHALDLEGYE